MIEHDECITRINKYNNCLYNLYSRFFERLCIIIIIYRTLENSRFKTS